MDGKPSQKDRKSIGSKPRSSKNKLPDKGAEGDGVEPTSPPPQMPPQRVFLYLRLQEITHLPHSNHTLELHVNHGTHPFTKLEYPFTTSNVIDLTDFPKNKPTISTIIEQDSIEELSKFSEFPVVLTLYEHIRPPKKNTDLFIDEFGVEEFEFVEEEDNVVEHMEPLFQGTIDILPFFSKKRSVTQIQSYLYPLVPTLQPNKRSCITEWQAYSLIPLLKELSFCNMAFITFESIYNISEDFKNRIFDLKVDFSFQSKVLNENKEYDKIKICSFSMFEYQIIYNQNSSQKWESIKDPILNNLHSLSIQTGCRINPSKRFKDLLWPEGVTINFDEIDTETEMSFACNSFRRFVVTDRLTHILENELAFNQQHILMEFYNSEQPELIILEGKIELPIFLYPNMNACRIAVALTSPKSYKLVPSTNRSKNSPTKSANRPSAPARVMFAIVAICVLSPITESPTPMSRYNNEILQALNMLCTEKMTPHNQSSAKKICDIAYTNFDKAIDKIIDYMIKNDYMTMDRAKDFFCCNLTNLHNQILKIIACDFNVRCPTKTNLEFTRLLTTVYKELEQRTYKIVQNNRSIISGHYEESNFERVVRIMNTVKYMYECGNIPLGDFLFDMLKTKNMNNNYLHLFIYLYYIETLQFEEAKNYDKSSFVHNFGEFNLTLTEMYIQYMNDSQNEETAPNSYENLLVMILKLCDVYPTEIDPWIFLHCLYKKSKYLPGMTFSRWKYENLYSHEKREIFPLPISRWDMYFDYKLNPKTPRTEAAYDVMQTFLSFGLYKFAEIVFQEIPIECSDAEKYLINTTFKIVQGAKSKKYSNKNFPGDLIKAYLSQVNGSQDFMNENMASAMSNYARILQIKNLNNYNSYLLGMMRLGYFKYEQNNFNESVDAFAKCILYDEWNLVVYIALGKAMYWLDRLEEAEEYFEQATMQQIHVPDVWAFLALINLKMGKNYNALECWKYAKLNPRNVISDEILEELDKIDPEDVFLYVDMPDKIPIV